MTAPVYLDDSLADAPAGSALLLDGEEGRHAATVRRARVGEQIDIVNGRGLRAHCEITEVTKSTVRVLVRESVTDPAPLPHITLVQALAKGGRDEQAVETATEFGVAGVIPWASDRSIASWRGKEGKGRARWVATARAATKQARRSYLPQVADVMTTPELVRWVSQFCTEGGRVFVCHEEATTRMVTLLHETGLDANARCCVVVGPEGGITETELARLTEAGGTAVLLGDHVLRSASAGPYAIATLSAVHILEPND